MSVLPESAELASDRDPTRRRRRGLGLGFWAAMVFAAACLLAAGIVAIVYGVFGGHAAAPTPAPAPAAAAAPPRSGWTPYPPVAPAPPATPAPAPQSGEQMASLEGRVGRLESAQARGLDAAAGALAAASLSEAAAGPRPFINDLAAVQRLMPDSPDVQALAPLAAEGAPTRAALAAELADIGARVSVAARTPAKDAGFMRQLGYAVSRVVSIRRVDAVGAGPDAVLARAQRRAGEGDLEGALVMLDRLPASARAELGDWRERAQRRIDIDNHIAALRALALTDLASVAGSTS